MYPPLANRTPVSSAYLPACFVLAILPFLAPRSNLLTSITTILLLVLCVQLPSFTFGDASSDYYNSGPIIALVPWYIEFVLCTPRRGKDAPAYVGSRVGTQEQGQRVEDLKTTPQRLLWAIRLMLPAQRGIGWSWQVKGIPENPYLNTSLSTCVLCHMVWATFYYAQSVAMLVVLGWSTASQESGSIIMRAIQGWSGAVWVWDRLNCAYSLGAAFTIAVRICDPWEWPPLMGSLRQASSVRQMWSVVYHQTFRRMLSQPALRIVRLVGIAKGSMLSRYMQLFITFSVSCVFHQLQMYTAIHSIKHEFTFFMLQPVAILVEDIVQSVWSRRMAKSDATTWLGYLWVVIWFGLCLPLYIGDLLEADIVSDWVFAKSPLEYGASLAR